MKISKTIASLCLASYLVTPIPAKAGDITSSCGTACAVDGTCCYVEAERPLTPTPVGGTSAFTGRARMMEEDPISDDHMGSATGTAGATVTIEVCNTAGSAGLSGPNGVDQNGFGEGDTIEVFIEWEYETTDALGTTYKDWKKSNTVDITKC